MFIPIIYGKKGKVTKDCCIGMRFCPNCGKFTEWYLGRVLQQSHVYYIPLSSKALYWYEMCGPCTSGKKITEDEFQRRSAVFHSFSDKAKLKECFDYAFALAAQSTPTQAGLDSVLTQLQMRYPQINDPMIAEEYTLKIKQMFAMLLKSGQISAEPKPEPKKVEEPQSVMIEVKVPDPESTPKPAPAPESKPVPEPDPFDEPTPFRAAAPEPPRKGFAQNDFFNKMKD